MSIQLKLFFYTMVAIGLNDLRACLILLKVYNLGDFKYASTWNIKGVKPNEKLFTWAGYAWGFDCDWVICFDHVLYR